MMAEHGIKMCVLLHTTTIYLSLSISILPLRLKSNETTIFYVEIKENKNTLKSSHGLFHKFCKSALILCNGRQSVTKCFIVHI